MIEKPTIILVPLGPVPVDLLDFLASALIPIFGISCGIAPTIPIPSAAYDQRRGQYEGHRVLTVLSRLDIPHAKRALGLVDADCYSSGLNFIFGQARIHGRDAFIALPRLRQSFYGLPEDEALFQQRALKEAVHELGHTYGLDHCPNPRCVMHFSNSLLDTDRKGAAFCTRCQTKLGTLMKGNGL
nr:archaemetzincin family Zn-dependent metalloprotease [Chloroflexota bacterium]